MITRQSVTTLVLGALAGAALGTGALAYAKRASNCCAGGRCDRDQGAGAPAVNAGGGPADRTPAAPAAPVGVPDLGTRKALEVLAQWGPADGRWSYRDSRRTIDQVMTHDPVESRVLHLQTIDTGRQSVDTGRPAVDTTSGAGASAATPGAAVEPKRSLENVKTRTVPRDVIQRVLFGSVVQFLENYAPCESLPSDLAGALGARGLVSVRWCSTRGGGGPSRNVWVDPDTHQLVRLEDRTQDGHLIRSLEFRPVAVENVVPPVPGAAEKVVASMSALSSRTIHAFEEFVSRVSIPIYEPAELPAGYARTEYGFDKRPFAEHARVLSVAWIGYDEGVMQMSLFIAPPDDMKQLETLARQGSAKGGMAAASSSSPVSGCASMPFDTPEELVESPGAVTVRVRSDGCRIVVRRDDLPGVSIAIVGSAATSRDDYIRVIRNLVLVPPKK